ncbi:MAG: helix-turn-helix transcriptional regulator [Mycoplasmatota bacterium]
MYSEELKNTLETARINKGVSQRELSKLAGISRSTFNDLVNGKYKKVDIELLKKLAETLDLSLERLLKEAGYDEFLNCLSLNKYKNKSTVDLKNLIDEYKKSELNLLEFDNQKRRKTSNARQTLFNTMEHLKIMKENKDSLYTIEKAIEDIENAFNELKDVQEKYDYTKLPKDK